ncbi:hypothetical protein AWB64_02381 [Caballeronia sordidicola]|uniref:DUF218 domain-containing protein n=2 Tax=Caballeronia sordidicola TaxID=196367 RepID=A0A158G8B0_CABSO|nr:hypothetical protein AWB64_02381 [Caballeronia sordidicola]
MTYHVPQFRRCIPVNAMTTKRIISETYTLPQTKLVLITLLLLFFALFAVWRQRRRAVVALCALLFWALGAGWLATPLWHFAQNGFEKPSALSDMRFASRTIFVLLGGGTRHDDDNRLIPRRDAFTRVVATADLYRECRRAGGACRVIVSGGNPQHHEQAEADNYAPFLLARGVSATDLLRENESLNTYENARNVARLLGPERDETFVLVTSAYHMRRSLAAFSAFGINAQPFVSNVRHPRVSFFPRPRGFVDAETALHELIGLARFYVYRFLRLY